MVTKAPGFPYVFRFVNTILASWKLRDKYLRLWKTRDMLLKSLRRAIRARSIFKRRHIWDIMWGASEIYISKRANCSIALKHLSHSQTTTNWTRNIRGIN